jgi:hypothetical protein
MTQKESALIKEQQTEDNADVRYILKNLKIDDYTIDQSLKALNNSINYEEYMKKKGFKGHRGNRNFIAALKLYIRELQLLNNNNNEHIL